MAEASGKPWGATVAVFAVAITSSAPAAARWTVTPDITVRETYTDNVFIGGFAGNPASSDFATQVTPGIAIEGTSPRLRGTFRFNPTAILYARNPSQDYVA